MFLSLLIAEEKACDPDDTACVPQNSEYIDMGKYNDY